MSDWGQDEYDEDGIEAQPIDVDDEPDLRPAGGGPEAGQTRTAVRDAEQQLAVANAEARRLDESRVNEQPATLYYGSVDEFVREYLRNVYRRRIDGRHRCWAGEWWRYDEALIRLEALWRSWEHLRQDPSTGMSVWWRDHADHHMAVLMDPEGPFALATEGETNTSRKGEPLPYIAPPEGMFPDVRRQSTAA